MVRRKIQEAKGLQWSRVEDQREDPRKTIEASVPDKREVDHIMVTVFPFLKQQYFCISTAGFDTVESSVERLHIGTVTVTLEVISQAAATEWPQHRQLGSDTSKSGALDQSVNVFEARLGAKPWTNSARLYPWRKEMERNSARQSKSSTMGYPLDTVVMLSLVVARHWSLV